MKTVNPDVNPTIGARLLAEPYSLRQVHNPEVNTAAAIFIDQLVGETPIAKVSLRPIEQTTLNREFQRLLEQIPDEDDRYRLFTTVFSAVDAVHGVVLPSNKLTANEYGQASRYVEKDKERTGELLRGVKYPIN